MNVFRFETVDSTNEVAKRLVRDQGCNERALVIAGEQTAGRGTRGRTWASPRGAGIYMTVIDFVTPVHWPQMAQCTRAAGVACVEILRAITGLEIGLKPINDLIVRNGKLGGILVEVLAVGEEAAILTGVGLNVRDVPRTALDYALPPIALEEVMDPMLWRRLRGNEIAESLAGRICEWNSIVATSDAQSLEFAWQLFARDWDAQAVDSGSMPTRTFAAS
ncbi:MAG: biotin--[acetyl-CoA-carboxylase] ligase [Planctomycetes bacterium]|nr:biotin--[acetyl-CoA-carboxylase] ligase [Planctomycetota bacterium]MBI3835101.1 biotin--[acetyl-CoA-carboxylase] ligase [Planctomycetota bacterium]